MHRGLRGVTSTSAGSRTAIPVVDGVSWSGANGDGSVLATAFYIGGPVDKASPEAAGRAGACSVTPEPDPQGSFYGPTQLFTLRAVEQTGDGDHQGAGRNDAAEAEASSVEVDGSDTAPAVLWKTENEKGLQPATSDVFVPLPQPLRGGWDVNIEPNRYSPAGYVATVRTNC